MAGCGTYIGSLYCGHKIVNGSLLIVDWFTIYILMGVSLPFSCGCPLSGNWQHGLHWVDELKNIVYMNSLSFLMIAPLNHVFNAVFTQK